MGLNHILLQPTDIRKAVQSIMQAFDETLDVLKRLGHAFHDAWIEGTATKVCERAWSQLKDTCRARRYSQVRQPYILESEEHLDEISWLQKHLYIAGLDKAANTPCFICLTLIWSQALVRLSSIEFLYCLDLLKCC